ncbi:MAG TPA: GDP-mannose 4,6-dehydratase [Candidatus Nitrosotenuis sp.]|nr:GDP-mannose 4,6-dehydratase [Candidatus Nitrosotenuis sp.]
MGVLVTGGAGFIGSNLLSLVVPARDYRLEVGDGACPDTLHPVMERHRPQVVLPFAAESQVDRSIRWPGQFVQTDVMGTCLPWTAPGSGPGRAGSRRRLWSRGWPARCAGISTIPGG